MTLITKSRGVRELKKDFPSDVNHWARNMEHEKMDVDVQPEIHCMDAE